MGVEYKATEQDEGAAAIAGDAAGDHQDGLAPSILSRGVSDRELVVGAEVSPASQPTFNAFPTNVAAAEGDGGGYAVLGWADGDLSTVDR